MKKNFLVSTGLIDTWEFEENNFLLGRWCEFYEFDEKKFDKRILKNDNIIKNIDHWDDHEKKNKDYKYLERKIEYLLEIISENLSIIHKVNENKEYWRVIVYNWLNQYVITIFHRWRLLKFFLKKIRTKNFILTLFHLMIWIIYQKIITILSIMLKQTNGII